MTNPGFVEALLNGADVNVAYSDTIDVDTVMRAIEDGVPIAQFEDIVSGLPEPSMHQLAFLLGFASFVSAEKRDVIERKFGVTAAQAEAYRFSNLLQGAAQFHYA